MPFIRTPNRLAFYRKWWINRRWSWYTLRRGGLAIHASCLLDFDSLDLTVWLGWLGFRVWYQAPMWNYANGVGSGYTLMWGRRKPLSEGMMVSLYHETKMWPGRSPLLKQYNIAGTFYMLPDQE